VNEKSPPSGECLKKDFVYGLRQLLMKLSQTVDKVLSPLCGGRAFLVAKNKNGNQKTRYEIPP